MSEIVDSTVQALQMGLAAIIVAFIVSLKDDVIRMIRSRTTAAQQEILRNIAQQAHAYAETLGVRDKMDSAVNYVLKHLHERGISITVEQVRAAIQEAWLTHNPQVKETPTVLISTPEVNVESGKVIPLIKNDERPFG